jgi:F0F1-type ATP synthase membrane subunit b/b'
MYVLITNFIYLFAGGGESGFMKFYQDYLNIPGFEAWKFLNLAIFVAALVYVLRKPLGAAFKEKREAIRAELIRAEKEKQEALLKLAAAEEDLAKLDDEKQLILQQAREEAEAEKKRLAEVTKAETERLRLQNESELSRLTAQTKSALRRFSAEETIRIAEERLRAQIDDRTDAKLVKASIQKIGGLN